MKTEQLSPELKRHLPPPKRSTRAPKVTSRGGGMSGAALTLLGCGVFTAACAAFPYLVTRNVRPLSNREEALNAPQIRRGAFNNSGSRDVGTDPKWDHSRGTYDHDRDREKKNLASRSFDYLISPFRFSSRSGNHRNDGGSAQELEK